MDLLGWWQDGATIFKTHFFNALEELILNVHLLAHLEITPKMSKYLWLFFCFKGTKS
jgi:hypothetical protein